MHEKAIVEQGNQATFATSMKLLQDQLDPFVEPDEEDVVDIPATARYGCMALKFCCGGGLGCLLTTLVVGAVLCS